MKIRLLMPIFVVVLTIGIQLNAEEMVQYTITNNFGAAVKVTTCNSIEGTTTCQYFDLLPALHSTFKYPQNSLSYISFWNQKINREEKIDSINPSWRSFTINPNGTWDKK